MSNASWPIGNFDFDIDLLDLAESGLGIAFGLFLIFLDLTGWIVVRFWCWEDIAESGLDKLFLDQADCGLELGCSFVFSNLNFFTDLEDSGRFNLGTLNP